jgi:CRP-like cAMP-binding protein
MKWGARKGALTLSGSDNSALPACRWGRTARSVGRAGTQARKGDVLGQVGLIEKAPRVVTVTAATPLRCFVLGSQGSGA